jgi:predicted RNA-binding Zn-ribbon protein involved in translation (DUF1610 family)
MSTEFTLLERNILKAKGLNDAQIAYLAEVGVAGRADFKTIGSPETLLDLMPDLERDVAVRVLEWAVPNTATSSQASTEETPPLSSTTIGGKVVLDTSDAVYCVHCGTKQPKDYNPGDLCPNCGKQAEPIESCYWCGSSGPGKYCRACGAAFVSTAELPLALLLRRDGVAKDDIPRRLEAMGPSEKDALWGRVRRARV